MSQTLAQLRNLCPVSCTWLNTVGIWTRNDLQQAGSMGAYLLLKRSGYPVDEEFLFSLQGALLDLTRDQLPDSVRQYLQALASRYH